MTQELQLRLRGEVVQISQHEDRSHVTIALDPRSLVEVVAERTAEAHLGDRVEVTVAARQVRLELAAGNGGSERIKEGS